jgi:hypothetical protein
VRGKMLKQSAQLEVKIGERVYQLNLPSESPLGEVHDALFQMRSFVINKINEAQKLDAPKEIVSGDLPVTDEVK